jgi:sortase (surface protein transpeptidase)
VTTTTSVPVASPVIPAVAAERSTPTQLQIPAIGLSVPLSTLGLNLDGTVQVPSSVQQAGWYRLGPSPGQLGSAVILGHVDSYQGPAVFFKLRSVVAGDLIGVNLADGAKAQFKVTSVSTYLKSNFPDQAVYGPHGFSELQLVTCGGTFDTQTGHYLSNIVVYSSLVSLTPGSGAPPG